MSGDPHSSLLWTKEVSFAKAVVSIRQTPRAFSSSFVVAIVISFRVNAPKTQLVLSCVLFPTHRRRSRSQSGRRYCYNLKSEKSFGGEDPDRERRSTRNSWQTCCVASAGFSFVQVQPFRALNQWRLESDICQLSRDKREGKLNLKNPRVTVIELSVWKLFFSGYFVKIVEILLYKLALPAT